MVCYYNQYHSEDTILWIPQIVNSKDGVDFAMLFTLLVFAFSFAPTRWSSLPATTQQAGKAGGLQILCCQGIEVTDYNFTLDALALKPSDFCNVRV
jgi:hypothetical protein